MTILTYSLIVTTAPEDGQASRHAYQFARAIIGKGHQLVSVFFYHAGVYNAGQFSLPPNDEFDVVSAWQALAKKHNVALHTCVSVSLRRGVINETEANVHKKTGANFAEHFQLSGLGEFASALLEQDRVIQF